MPTSLRAACALAVLSLSFTASAQFEGVADARMTSREDGNRMEAKGRLYISPRGWSPRCPNAAQAAWGPRRRARGRARSRPGRGR